MTLVVEVQHRTKMKRHRMTANFKQNLTPMPLFVQLKNKFKKKYNKRKTPHIKIPSSCTLPLIKPELTLLVAQHWDRSCQGTSQPDSSIRMSDAYMCSV